MESLNFGWIFHPKVWMIFSGAFFHLFPASMKGLSAEVDGM